LTLKQLEALTGISKSTLNTIENGITSPTLRQLEAIAAALDVKITDLFDSEYK
jgi:transcriptional regulator with XRE-family HTH domain